MVPLDGLLALDAVTVVAEQSAQISAAIQAGNAEALSDREFPPIARVRQQLARARADLRRRVRVLKHQTALDLGADGGGSEAQKTATLLLRLKRVIVRLVSKERLVNRSSARLRSRTQP